MSERDHLFKRTSEKQDGEDHEGGRGKTVHEFEPPPKIAAGSLDV
jgi:hypothetical protein